MNLTDKILDSRGHIFKIAQHQQAGPGETQLQGDPSAPGLGQSCGVDEDSAVPLQPPATRDRGVKMC